jgi:hypothetical protein
VSLMSAIRGGATVMDGIFDEDDNDEAQTA